jgi:hypothetical protein
MERGMKNKKISNSKYKNTGVLFELLVRQITSDTLVGKPKSAAMDIMKRYFSASTELGKEMQLYRAFFETNKLTENKAIHFVDLILAQRKKLDERKLAKEKYELIKEISNAYPLKEFLSCKLPNYIIHASIYKTFASDSAERSDTAILNINEVAEARFTLVEHLSGKSTQKDVIRETEQLNEFKQQTEDMRLLALKLMIDKFNERFDGLNDKQKDLLREFIYNVSNTNSLTTYAKKEIPFLKESLLKGASKTKNKIMAIKINEVASQLDRIASKRVIKDADFSALMIAYEIDKELNTNKLSSPGVSIHE